MSIDFVLPKEIQGFIFELHQATRRIGGGEKQVEDVARLYDVRFKELSEKYFSQSPWPTSNEVAAECSYDEDFLLFYREMTLRHLFSKQKPTLSEHFESWTNFVNLFTFLINSRSPEMIMTPQWAHEIVQEFVYHFQDFCQFRANVSQRSEEDKTQLQANKDVWSLNEVVRLLGQLTSLVEKVCILICEIVLF